MNLLKEEEEEKEEGEEQHLTHVQSHKRNINYF